MKKVFNINLGGYPYSIDDDAYAYVQQYLETIEHHFSTSKGCDEILYDIEVRMAELFQEHLKGRLIISMKEVDEVVAIMGKPEDFGAEPIEDPYSFSEGRSYSSSGIGTGKKLFRNMDDKKIAGVCSGISAYFGIEDPIWVRLIFVLLFFTIGSGVLVYLILWAMMPEAKTASDKLSMRGEPTTVSNIAKMVEEEITDLGQKINKWSKDFTNKN
ncbi:MAG: PspC domain-containing protein [Chitinophagales bacterium]|nr:PspC domain-containing protein [Chitinophagales bacterium]